MTILNTNATGTLKLDAKKDLIARLDQALALATEIEFQVQQWGEMLENEHLELLAA